MNTNELLDAYKKHHYIPSDYGLADKLRVNRANISLWRRRGMPERLAFRIAKEMLLDPAPILAAVRGDHAKDPEIKKTWEKIARTVPYNHFVFALVSLAMLIFSAPESARASLFAAGNNIHYTNIKNISNVMPD